MTAHEDREKVLAAFGGKKGLIDSGIPSVIFLVVLNVTDRLNTALFASIAISALLTIIRLAKRDTIQHSLSGFIGVLICAWFANRTGSDGQLKLELIKETYVSVGINGVGKIKEGDGKTPLGVYFIQKNLPGATLPDLFGVGALTLNYPNAVDAMRNKTGSGIWLHGTPSAQYSRAPEATDGCVVLANPEMEQIGRAHV